MPSLLHELCHNPWIEAFHLYFLNRAFLSFTPETQGCLSVFYHFYILPSALLKIYQPRFALLQLGIV